TRRLNGNQSRDRRQRAGDKGRECPTCSVGVALARRSRSADRAPQRRRVRWPFTSPWFEPQPRWGQPLDTTVAGRATCPPACTPRTAIPTDQVLISRELGSRSKSCPASV